VVRLCLLCTSVRGGARAFGACPSSHMDDASHGRTALQITLSLSSRPIRGVALRGMPFTRGVASLSPSLERHA
jgi:hypothetical protein